MPQLLLLPIRFYRYFISPLMASHCRYYPTCSEYAETAIGLHGPLKGGSLTILRLLRCHPGCAGGYDPVPGSTESMANNEKVKPCTDNSPSTAETR